MSLFIKKFRRTFLLWTLLLTVLSGTAQAQSTIFFDDFESGTGHWLLTGYWGLSPENFYSPSFSLADSPWVNYYNNTLTTATLDSTLNLSGYLSAQLSFKALYSLETGFDFVYVQASSDNFTTFTNLGELTGENVISPDGWNEYTYSLGGFAGGDLQLRFLFYSDSYANFDGIYIDDVNITASYVDDQPPLVMHNPPVHYESSIGPVSLQAQVMDASGISSAFLNFRVDGLLQPETITGYETTANSFIFELPARPAGALIEYWITAIDGSVNHNTIVTDTFAYISGNYIKYDNSTPNFYMMTGPASSSPSNTAWAVRVTLPETAPNLVSALIQNYTDINHPNDSMMVHVWDADSTGGVGNDLIPPFMVAPSATLEHADAMTRIDLRAFSAQLSNRCGDVYIGYTVPAGLVNTLLTGPGTFSRSFLHDGSGWQLSGSDFIMRAVSGPNNVDAGLSALSSPLTGNNLGSHEAVTVIVRNPGYQTLTNIPLSYSVDGLPPVYDTLQSSLAWGESQIFTFATGADLSAFGPHTVTVSTLVNGDQNAANDTISVVITHINFSECDTVHFDGPHQINMGLSNTGSFKTAVHFPPDVLLSVMGGKVEKIRFYIAGLPLSCSVKIWDNIAAYGPGNEVFNLDVTNVLTANSWNEVSLPSDYYTGSDGFWAGLALTQTAGSHPMGADGGTANSNADWISFTPGNWQHNPSYSSLGNWNIRAVICPAVLPQSTLQGYVSYSNIYNTKIKNASVYLFSGDVIIKQTITDSLGHFEISGISQGTYILSATSSLPWGGGNAVDALAVLRHFVGLSALQGLSLTAADVNADGNINSMDALSIVRRFVGLIPGFPNGDWVFESHTVIMELPGNYSVNILGLCTGDVDASYVPVSP